MQRKKEEVLSLCKRNCGSDEGGPVLNGQRRAMSAVVLQTEDPARRIPQSLGHTDSCLPSLPLTHTLGDEVSISLDALSSLQRGVVVPSGSDPQKAAGTRCGERVSNLGKVESQSRIASGTLSFLSGQRCNRILP